jgi:hypothetical protein
MEHEIGSEYIKQKGSTWIKFSEVKTTTWEIRN